MFNSGNKLEDKEKIILFLKGEIKELSKPKEEESIDSFKVDNYSLLIKKLNQDVIDLDINNKELKNQIAELESKHKNLNEKVTIISYILYYHCICSKTRIIILLFCSLKAFPLKKNCIIICLFSLKKYLLIMRI